MDQLFLLLPSTSYQVSEFISAAAKLDLELIVGTDQSLAINAFGNDNLIQLDFSQPELAASQITKFAGSKSPLSVVGIDETTALVAAYASRQIGLIGNSPEAVRDCHDKFLFRQRLGDSDLLNPQFRLIKFSDVDSSLDLIQFPCVMKPLGLSASRGVIRANNPNQYFAAARTILEIIQSCQALPHSQANCFICEDFIPGTEVAVEAILSQGQLTPLAIFDKPNPLNGPYFEESIYLTPSTHSLHQQHAMFDTVQQACDVLKLIQGPVHAELRLNRRGCWLVEMANRTIGGRCSNILKFGDNVSLQELILRQAIGQPIDQPGLSSPASGVMMMPIHNSGRLKSIAGIEDARSIDEITDITIDIPLGDTVFPLPYGDRYLGFIFAHGSNRQRVEWALREAFNRITIEIIE